MTGVQTCALPISSRERTFLPVVTAALNYAFEERMPGLAYFARTLAFSLPEGNNVGGAVVWFVEPWSSGQSVMPVLAAVLKHPDERRQLFGCINELLRRMKEAKNRLYYMRRMSRMGWTADERELDVEGARALLAPLANCEAAQKHEILLASEKVRISNPA